MLFTPINKLEASKPFALQSKHTSEYLSSIRTLQTTGVLYYRARKSKLVMGKNNGGATATTTKKGLQSKGLGRFLKQQRGRIYIIRTCVVMLLCWHD
ncbi:uncharacterized protein LOC141662028 [Apium graveolens]|uniref:uncharacterized protein LOC141662028 n=1 Tax=Apium graveolens TaxID=4045 RepID=UPI003D7AB15F